MNATPPQPDGKSSGNSSSRAGRSGHGADSAFDEMIRRPVPRPRGPLAPATPAKPPPDKGRSA